MEQKHLSQLTSIVGSVLEQNISEIEKIHSRIKLSRFIGVNLFFLTGLSIISAYIYAYTFLKEFSIIITILFFLIFFILINLFKKKLYDSPFLTNLMTYTMFVALPPMFGAIMFDVTIETIQNGLSLETLKISFPFLVGIILFFYCIYAMYHFSRVLASLVVQKIIKSDYQVLIFLTNGQALIGSLVTINKKNDYIIRGKDGEEILIKNSAISYIKLTSEN